jgi:hypothetical protein
VILSGDGLHVGLGRGQHDAGVVVVVRLCFGPGGVREVGGGRRQEAGGRRQEAGGRRQEAGGRRQEAGGRRQEAGGRGIRLSRPRGTGPPIIFIILGVGNDEGLPSQSMVRRKHVLDRMGHGFEYRTKATEVFPADAGY